MGFCGNVLENRTRCTSVNWDRALSSLLFALKAKINYETSALSCYVNGRCTCMGRTCVPTAIVRGVAGNSWNGPFRASAYPLACKITFPPPRYMVRFFPILRTSSSFRYYTATINPRWAYRYIERADCFICIISIENNPPRSTYKRECRRLAMNFYVVHFFVSHTDHYETVSANKRYYVQ